jgi:SAM-dependent methyltransferase
MQLSQSEVFARSECDRWFARNKSALEQVDLDNDFPLKIMELYRLRPRRVLEIAAANGYRLAAIARRTGAEAVAVELSAAAVSDGKAKFPEVEFVHAAAHAIPLDEPFDLVIVNGLFYVVDRTELLRSIAEIDRLVADGGFLILGDFLPANLLKVRYHHVPQGEIYSYKQDYSAAFLASGLYHPVSLLTGDSHSRDLNPEARENDRFCVWLLRKMLHDHYAESSLGR